MGKSGPLVFALVLAFATTATGGGQGIRIGQPAPEIAGAPWINSPPLRMEELRGRVVLVEFWTYG